MPLHTCVVIRIPVKIFIDIDVVVNTAKCANVIMDINSCVTMYKYAMVNTTHALTAIPIASTGITSPGKQGKQLGRQSKSRLQSLYIQPEAAPF